MLEIYLLSNVKDNNINQFVTWCTDLSLPTIIKQAPRSPLRHFSSFVYTSHLQAGIEYEPLFPGVLRILLGKHIPVPQTRIGMCVGSKMVAGHTDLNTLNVTALHELGHALRATARRQTLMRIMHEDDVQARKEIDMLIKAIGSTNASQDGVVDYKGLHCLNASCIMQYNGLSWASCKGQKATNLSKLLGWYQQSSCSPNQHWLSSTEQTLW